MRPAGPARTGSRRSSRASLPSARSRLPVALAALALAAAGTWAYSTSFGGVFVCDDGPAIVDNPNIKALLPLGRAMTAPSEATVSGRPIPSLTLALNYTLAPPEARDVLAPPAAGLGPDSAALFHRNLWGYHFMNLVIHLAAGLTLFGVMRRTFAARMEAGDRGRTQGKGAAQPGSESGVQGIFGGLRASLASAATPLAFSIALIWIVHPLQTQSVTYIVQRVESLMGLFYLLTLYCAIRAARPGLRRTWWAVGSIAACALGMGSKEVMVTAPLMVVLWYTTFRVNWRRRHLLYAGLASTWLVLVALVASETRSRSVGFHLGWTAWSYLMTQAGVLVHYLRLSFVPVPLVFDYGWPKAQSLAEVAPEATLLVILLALTTVGLVRRWPIALAGAWFFAILAPTSSVLPITTEIASEHRMYLPVAAIITLAVLGAHQTARHLIPRVLASENVRRRVALTAGIILVATVAAAFSEMTRARNRDYWSDEGLWFDTVQKRPMNAHARAGYAVNLVAQERWAEAETQLRLAVQLDPSHEHAHMNLGSALCALGRVDEGIGHLERARALAPGLPETYGLLGEAYASKGNMALALQHFSRAIQLLPDNPTLLGRVAFLLATSADESVRDGAKAVEYASRAVRLTGGQDVRALDALAAASAEQGDFSNAMEVIREAMAVAGAQGKQDVVLQLQQRLALYQAGRKLRMPLE